MRNQRWIWLPCCAFACAACSTRPAAPSSPVVLPQREKLSDVAPPSLANQELQSVPGLRFSRSSTEMSAEWPPTLARDAARVQLPLGADGFARVADAKGGFAVRFAIVGAESSAGQVENGLVRYPLAIAGHDVVHRVTPAGTEDFVLLPVATGLDSIAYEIDVRHAAGLRLVSNTLEFVDAEGAPRVRVPPPYVVGADGQRHGGRISIDDCAVDDDASAPWGRRPVSAGADRCHLRVAWDAPHLAYPARLDPAFTLTNRMATGRVEHTATTLKNGTVLVTGGDPPPSTGPLSASELFDPVTKTWAATGTMADRHSRHSATLLADGRVLIAGGASFTVSPTAEIYDPGDGKWHAAPALPVERDGHAASPLPGGLVLITGGDTGVEYLKSATIFDPTGAGAWKPAPDMSEARQRHTSTALADGRVLVVGGEISGTQSKTAEIFDPMANEWSSAGTLKTGRADASIAVLPGGTVLVTGGNKAGGASELMAVATRTWSVRPFELQGRTWATGTALSDGSMFVVGGIDTSANWPATGELLGPLAGAWNNAGSLHVGRYLHTTQVLSDDRTSATLLVTGGYSASSTGMYPGETSVEIVVGKLLGKPCTTGTACMSGSCADGVCCDSPCTGLCQACVAAKSGTGADGHCSPNADGTDPDEECPTEDVSTCGKTGACNGSGTCALHAKGRTCKQQTCGPNIVSLMVESHFECDGAGSCKQDSIQCTNPSPNCAASDYVCKSTPACYSSSSCDPNGDAGVTGSGAGGFNGSGGGNLATGGTEVVGPGGGQPTGAVASPASDSGCGCRFSKSRQGPGRIVGVVAFAYLAMRRYARRNTLSNGRPRSSSRPRSSR